MLAMVNWYWRLPSLMKTGGGIMQFLYRAGIGDISAKHSAMGTYGPGHYSSSFALNLIASCLSEALGKICEVTKTNWIFFRFVCVLEENQ
jgi:hypothetical protein